MKTPGGWFLAALMFLAAFGTNAVAADFLKNGNLKEGMAGWHGDGEMAFLNPDGTEGGEMDPGVTPVIKLPLSHGGTHMVYQEITAPSDLKSLSVTVEVYASRDFKRSKFETDYTDSIHWTPGSTWYWSAAAVPPVDFWIRCAPGYLYKLASLKIADWTTVHGKWDAGASNTDRVVGFVVPPGESTIYIRKAAAGP
jgi:hypothetical protein